MSLALPHAAASLLSLALGMLNSLDPFQSAQLVLLVVGFQYCTVRGYQKIVGRLDAGSSAAIGGSFTTVGRTSLMGALNVAGKDELGNSLSVLDNFNAGSNFSVTKDAVLYSQLPLCWLLRQFGRQANLQGGITTSTDF